MKTKTKLTTIEMIAALLDAENIAIYRMYTSVGVSLYMKIAKFHYRFNHKVVARFLSNVLLIFVDAIDLFLALIEKCLNK